MEKITLIKCDDGKVWVTSDEDQIGTESEFNEDTDIKEQMLVSLANFFGFDPTIVLDLDAIEGKDKLLNPCAVCKYEFEYGSDYPADKDYIESLVKGRK